MQTDREREREIERAREPQGKWALYSRFGLPVVCVVLKKVSTFLTQLLLSGNICVTYLKHAHHGNSVGKCRVIQGAIYIPKPGKPTHCYDLWLHGRRQRRNLNEEV